jgi:hypothetical protein
LQDNVDDWAKKEIENFKIVKRRSFSCSIVEDKNLRLILQA